MTDDRFSELLSRLLDDELSVDELAELVHLAKQEPARTEEIRGQLEAAEMIALSEDVLRDPKRFLAALRSRIPEDPFVSQVRSRIRLDLHSRVWRALNLWGWSAAGALVLMALLVWWIFQPQSPIKLGPPRVMEVAGAVRWMGITGEIEDQIERGQTLTAGSLEALTTNAFVHLQFPDGKTVSIFGESSLAISAGDQKILHLVRGVLWATVARQPRRKPMRILTPVAELRVIGTQFKVEVESFGTRLKVNEGRILLKPTTSGETAEVSAGHEALASMDPAQKLRVIEFRTPIAAESFDYPAGYLRNNNGGTGWRNAWQDVYPEGIPRPRFYGTAWHTPIPAEVQSGRYWNCAKARIWKS
jgi:hypothetical protein